MGQIGFSAEKYMEMQTEHILERIENSEGNRLYLEFGGKLVQDKHAMRVLPGFDENAKIKLLQRMKDQAEIIICVYSGDITTNKTRQDFGITYDLEVLRLIDMFRKYDLEINSVVVTRYEENSPAVDKFINKLERRGIKTYKHRFTKGYPTDVETIVSDEGYGANPYIEVTKPLAVVTGPGGGSGKLATCLSQLYHEAKRGRKVPKDPTDPTSELVVDYDTIREQIDVIKNEINEVSTVRAQFGSYAQRIEMTQNSIDENKIIAEERRAGLQDIDIVEALSQLAQQQYALQASMQITSQMLSNSLLNYM